MSPYLPTDTALQSLTSTSQILQAFTYRHHNQHRRAHWWPVLLSLRRALRNLLSSLATASATNSALAIKTGKSKRDGQGEKRAVRICESVLPRTYLAFSQLAADNQYAPLGLLLLGCLARIRTSIHTLFPSTNTLSSGNPTTVADTTHSSLHPRLEDGKTELARQDGDGADLGRGVSIARPLQSQTPESKGGKAKTSSPALTSTVTTKSSVDPRRDSPIREGKKSSTKNKDKDKKKKKRKDDALSSLFDSL